MGTDGPLERAARFAKTYGLQLPILLAPMAGACPPELSIAVANAGGMGGAGVLTMLPEAIAEWVRVMRSGSNGAFQLNVRVPDPAPDRSPEGERAMRTFLSSWGPDVPEDAADAPLPDFDAQLEAMFDAGPTVVSSHMGLLPPGYVSRLKRANISWFASVTSVREAMAAEAAGADAIVAQGMEAGGHRATFDQASPEAAMVGLFALVPAIADAVKVPVIATGGIGDARGVAAALVLGASAVQIGTAFLRTPQAEIAPDWADGLVGLLPEDTTLTRAFSGRLARSLRTPFVVASSAVDAPTPQPYPIQNNLTQAMRSTATKAGALDGMSAWAGQAARLARAASADEIVADLWSGATELLVR